MKRHLSIIALLCVMGYGAASNSIRPAEQQDAPVEKQNAPAEKQTPEQLYAAGAAFEHIFNALPEQDADTFLGFGLNEFTRQLMAVGRHFSPGDQAFADSVIAEAQRITNSLKELYPPESPASDSLASWARNLVRYGEIFVGRIRGFKAYAAQERGRAIFVRTGKYTASYLAMSIPATVGPDLQCEMFAIQHALGRLVQEAQMLQYLASWQPDNMPWDDAVCTKFGVLVQGLRWNSRHITAPASLVHPPIVLGMNQ